jgi:hypothetical protein
LLIASLPLIGTDSPVESLSNELANGTEALVISGKAPSDPDGVAVGFASLREPQRADAFRALAATLRAHYEAVGIRAFVPVVIAASRATSVGGWSFGAECSPSVRLSDPVIEERMSVSIALRYTDADLLRVCLRIPSECSRVACAQSRWEARREVQLRLRRIDPLRQSWARCHGAAFPGFTVRDVRRGLMYRGGHLVRWERIRSELIDTVRQALWLTVDSNREGYLEPEGESS